MNTLHNTGRIIRPPFEARSTYLQVTCGCSHNKCKYCTYYKNICYQVSPNEEILEDIQQLKDNGYTFKRIWLQSADALSLSTKKLLEISKMIHEKLPFVESIGAYARVDSFKNKTTEELRQLKDAGYDGITVGVESGDDCVLRRMNKGYTGRDILEQMKKLDENRMKYTLIFLNGLAGKDPKHVHATKTAQIFNKTRPYRIMINSLKIDRESLLEDEMQKGNFTPMTDDEKREELITFLEKLETDTFIDATNSTNTIKFFGKVRENRDEMVENLRKRKLKQKTY